MKPSDLQFQQPNDSDLLAAKLARDMLECVSDIYHNASEDERLEMTLQYGSVVHRLQRVVAKAARRLHRQSAS